MDEKKKEADSVSHFSAERIFGFWGGKNAQYFGLLTVCEYIGGVTGTKLSLRRLSVC